MDGRKLVGRGNFSNEVAASFAVSFESALHSLFAEAGVRPTHACIGV
jgi:hypothetical protein